MGTVAGLNTRRYHGLLIASLNPPADRYSIFPRVEEIVECNGQQFNLATVQYPGVVSPSGYQLLTEFSALPFPTWRYACGPLTVEKSVRLLDAEQSVVVTYRASSACKLHIRLFVSFRDYHSLAHRNSSLNPQIAQQPGTLVVQPYAHLPPLTIHHPGGAFEPAGVWFNDHEYLRELERGLDFREDLYSPGILHFDLPPNQPLQLVATLETGVRLTQKSAPSFTSPLARALDQFRVLRSDGKPTLIAGYPWFTDWSRDTLISLPALIAAGFEPAETKAILEFLLAERKQGILPNRFSDQSSTPEYNTVDASLWFFIAAHAYLTATPDNVFLSETIFPAALDIIDWYRRGTFFGIRVDPEDQLLTAGGPGTQLTWMDAKIGDDVVTPRLGKPVEINALWFNALRITSDWAGMLGNTQASQQLLQESEAVQDSFSKKFWNANSNCLYDVLTPSGPDPAFRPNQLAAAALPYPLVNQARARLIVESVRQKLLTPAGLRTLDPADPRYCPHFEGDMSSRDRSYHQGTVWPWLIGPFISAYLYAFHDEPTARSTCRTFLDPILQLASKHCLGTIGEVFDADPPHNPGGCPAQLWSVAQVLLALHLLKD